MNSQTKTKFKVGDWVECIAANPELGCHGAGWEEGFKFQVIEMTNSNDIGHCIYWRAKDRHGVYEPWLRLVNEDWDD